MHDFAIEINRNLSSENTSIAAHNEDEARRTLSRNKKLNIAHNGFKNQQITISDIVILTSLRTYYRSFLNKIVFFPNSEMNIRTKILWNVQPHLENVGDKVSIIGAGMVGIATAVSVLGTGVTKNLVLVDAFGDKVKGEVMDLQQGSLFLKYPRISGGNDFSATQGSKLCIITAGVRQEAGESRLTLAQRNSDIMVKLVPELIKYSPETILLMVGNPCDVLTYVAWKVSGLPQHKVLGAGTTLDTQRFRVLIAKKFRVNPANVHAWIIGEHGDNSIPLWSSVNISGMKLKDLNPLIGRHNDPEKWIDLHREVIGAAGAIQELKGYTNWGVGMSVAAMARSILGNKLAIYPVSVNANGKYGIADDIFLPLPAVLGSNGVCDIINLNLSPEELASLQDTAALLKTVQDGIHIKGADVKCKCRRCRT
ncbi:hypothetical protein HHI36_014880 [Cryptolaemus montrouzieri]|uniref:L-lactate dehydrogenase n=1 Tax=Cryptolaemus montrouzieri TaxID=559131 RepID=A0ABD2N411_9CUCU